MRFCPRCGDIVQQLIPPGDNRLREVCRGCGAVNYQNPKVVVGCLPEWKEQVLLCRRAIEPRLGFWTLPAGFMENGETVTQGAVREVLEEANARVEIGELYAMFSLPYLSQVYLLFRARLLDLDFYPGIESQSVRLFSEAEIPWPQLAFTTIRCTLRYYFQDRRTGSFPLHMEEVLPSGRICP